MYKMKAKAWVFQEKLITTKVLLQSVLQLPPNGAQGEEVKLRVALIDIINMPSEEMAFTHEQMKQMAKFTLHARWPIADKNVIALYQEIQTAAVLPEDAPAPAEAAPAPAPAAEPAKETENATSNESAVEEPVSEAPKSAPAN